MTKLLLSVHVLAAILTIGPVSVAASMFPPAARASLAAPDDVHASATMATLHRVCRVYSVIGLFVPAFGLATAVALGVLTDVWLLTSIGLTLIAAAVLALAVLPGQRELMTTLSSSGGAGSLAGGEPAAVSARQRTARLAGAVGIFNLLWAVVVVLMIVRPGSTTGVS